MKDIIIIAVLICILSGVIYYIVNQKKRSGACIGCPYCKNCSGKCSDSNGKEQK